MKKVRFIVPLAIYLLLALADGTLTYLNTPDLAREGNPLVSVLGLGWGALFAANCLAFALIALLLYYSVFRYRTRVTDQTRFTRYCSQIVYDRPDMFWKGFIPKHLTPIIAGLGYAIAPASIVSRAMLVLEWLFVTLGLDISGYTTFTDKYCFGRPDVIVAIVLAIVLEFLWFYKEFKKQLAMDPGTTGLSD